jgi:peptidoglycan/xylan/chitin deacetylase (PgdA/CDA1 family)
MRTRSSMQQVTSVLKRFLPGGRTDRREVSGQGIDNVEGCWPSHAKLPAAVLHEKLAQVRREMPIGAGAKRTLKLTISLAYYLVRGLSRFVIRLTGRSPKRGLVILYYHGIPDACRSSFAHQLESIRRTARVFPASHRGSLPSDKPNVAITFDDAYVSVARNALPALASRGFHSTIFVPTAMLGGAPTWQMEDGSPDAFEVVMPAEQIAKLSSPIVMLGSHSCTHPRLSRLTPSEAREEIEGSRTRLQELTALDIRLFALPYGDHNASTIEICRTAGYETVFSTRPAPVDTTDVAFVRGRVKVDPFDGPLEFFLKYNGAYAWAPYLSSLKRRVRGNKPSAAVQASSLGQPAPYEQPKRS